MGQKERSRFEKQSQLEHRGLRLLLRDFSRALRSPAGQRAMEEQFAKLHLALRDHFAFEEDGGYFEEVLSDAPWLEHEVKILRRQHAKFLQEMLELEGLVAPRQARGSW